MKQSKRATIFPVVGDRVFLIKTSILDEDAPLFSMGSSSLGCIIDIGGKAADFSRLGDTRVHVPLQETWAGI